MKRRIRSAWPLAILVAVVVALLALMAVPVAAVEPPPPSTWYVEARELPSITIDGAVTTEEWGVADFPIDSDDTYHLGLPGNALADISYDVYIESDDSYLYVAFKATDAPEGWDAVVTHYGGEIFAANLYIDANNNDVLDEGDHAISGFGPPSLFEASAGNWTNPVDLNTTPVEWSRSWENKALEYKIPLGLLGIDPGDTLAFATQAYGYGWYPEGSECTFDPFEEHPEAYEPFTLPTFATIQGAIDAADTGDTVSVAAGLYLEDAQIEVPIPLTIQGAGREDTEVRREGTPPYGQYWRVFDVSAVSDVTISDMTVGYETLLPAGGLEQTPVPGYVIAHGPGYSPTDNLRIDNVAFDGGRSAILSSGTGLVVQNCLVTGEWQRASIRPTGTDFLITGNDFQGLHYKYGPVMLGGDALEGEISYNEMSNGQIPGYFSSGGSVFTVEVYTTNVDLVIVGNTFDGVTNRTDTLNQAGNPPNTCGVYSEGTGNTILVDDNDFDGYDKAIMFYGLSDVRITENAMIDGGVGILLFGTEGEVNVGSEGDIEDANTITGSTKVDIWVYSAGPLDIYLWEGNVYDTMLIEDSDEISVHLPEGEAAESTVAGEGSVEAPDADASVGYDIEEGETATITTESLAEEEVEEATFGAAGKYVDVKVAEEDIDNVEELMIAVYYTDEDIVGLVEGDLIMYWHDGENWCACSDTGVDTSAIPDTPWSGYIWAYIYDDSSPTLAQMTGTPFGPGGGLALDQEYYKVGDLVTVMVGDADANTEPGVEESVGVWVFSETLDDLGADYVLIALQETGPDTGVFVGAFDLVGTTPGTGELLVSHGDWVEVEYGTGPPDWDWLYAEATVDNVGPTINNLTPGHEAKVTTATPTISATLADTGDADIDTASVEMTVDGSPVTATVTTTSVSYTPSADLAQGSHSVTVDASDNAGNAAATVSWSFTVDTTLPVIGDLAPEDTSFVDTATPTMSATFSDVGAGIDTESVVIEVDEVDVTEDADVTAEGVSYTPAVALEEGSHDVTVDVDDLAGNSATQAAGSFTVDSTNPVIAIDAVLEETYLPTQDVTGTYTEINLDTIKVNGEDVAVDEGAGTWAITIYLSIGSNDITAEVTDLAGNTGSASDSILYAPLQVATVTVETEPDEILADGVSTTGITVTVVDATDPTPVPIAGMTVTLETTAGIIYPTSAVTDSSGVVTAELTSETILGEVTVTATCEGVTGTATVAFVADSAPMPDLVVGWNLISLPLIPISSDIDDVLEDLGIAADVDAVWSYDAATGWSGYHPSTGIGELDRMEDGKGYWVRMLAPAEGLTVSGFEMPAPGETPRQYAVAEGWNLIGIKSTSTTAPEDYLAAIEFTSVYGFDQEGYFSVVEGELEPGYGYWVYATEDGYIAP